MCGATRWRLFVYVCARVACACARAIVYACVCVRVCALLRGGLRVADGARCCFRYTRDILSNILAAENAPRAEDGAPTHDA